MKFRNSPFLLALAALAVVVLAGISIRSPRVYANDDDNESKIQVGFKIAPVPLNLDGKNRALVGLGATLSTHRATAMVATVLALLPNSSQAETHTLASRRRSTRRPTWVAAGILVPSPGQVHFHTSSRAI